MHCARRKAACIPQGDVQDASVTDTVLQLDTETATNDDALVPFFKALHELRRHAGDSLRSSYVDNQGASSGPVLDRETVQSNCAPVIQLLNHQLVRNETDPALQSHIADQETQIGRRSDWLRNETSQQDTNIRNTALVLYEILTAVPPDPDIAEILTARSRWWGTWRQSFGLAWGEEEDRTLTQFATRAVRAKNPSLLGSLLLCFAFSTGDYNRYLTPVESWMLADTFHATNVYDFQFLMGLGLCLMSALRPRRAWMVYRKANTLLQLAGIHRSHRRSEALDLIFWQLFSADRWVSLLIGLPHSVPDHLCYLPIPPIDQSTPVTFHHRHMTLLTGRVIDCLQSPTGFSFTSIVSVEEEIDEVTAQLPPNYLSMSDITACPDADERSARLYRLTEVFQLKTFLYLPLFLQQCNINKQKPTQGQMMHSYYGRTACLSSARSLLETFLILYDMDPTTAVVDNSMKLTSFTALTAAVVLFLNLLAGSHPTESSDSDTMLINKAVAVFEACSEGKPRSLCGQCHTALADLVSCSQTLGKGESREIVVPYFGSVEITRKESTSLGSPEISSSDRAAQPISTMVDPTPTNVDEYEHGNDDFPALIVPDDVFFSYHGHWESYLQGPSWDESLDGGLDPINEDLGCYFGTDFPM